MHNFKLLETTDNKSKASWAKKIIKGLTYLVLFILVITVSLVSLLFIYEDEVKAVIVKELNKYLKAEVRIDPKNINLTIIKSFPDCSLEFKDLLMLEALPVKKRDTLLFTKQLNLYFNIKDLWNKQYEIQQVKLKDAIIRLVILKNGKNNYTFWEEEKSNTTPKNDSLKFNLKLLQLENCLVNYKDKQHLFKTELNIKKTDFKGSFKESNFDMETKGEILIKNITQQKTSYLSEKTLVFNLDLSVNGSSYQLKNAAVTINQLALELNGGFTYQDSLQAININYKAPKLDISSALSLLPESFKNKINDYDSDGNFYAQGVFRYASSTNYLLETSFGIKNGEVTYRPLSTTAENINLEGFLKYSPSNSLLELKTFYLNLNKDEIKGNCIIKNFLKPQIKMVLKAGLNLENLQNFWPIDTLTKLKGNLVLNVNVDGELEDLKSRTFSNRVNLNLDASVSELEVQFKGDEKIYTVESGSINAKDREVKVRDLKLKRGSSDLKVNGKMPGIFNYLSDHKTPLVIQGNLFSNYLKMEDFMVENKKNSEGNNNPIIPDNVEFKLNAAILKFTFAGFEAQNITGEIEIKNQKAIINEMKLETMEGDATIDAFADNSKGKLDVVLESNLTNININKLFEGFNNFGQTTLQNKNLKGYASATVNFSGSWSNQLETDYKSIISNADVSIEKGELIDFQPLLSLGKYLDVNDLKHIKFSSLNSSIEIAENKIVIPRTSIKNSALNIDLRGSHTFDNYIDYHLRLLYEDLKAKRKKGKQDEFGPVVTELDKKRTIFIKMVGNIDDPKIDYDVKDMKEKIKEDWKEEKQNVRKILKEEIGLFKKDSIKKSAKTPEQVFELEKATNSPKKSVDVKNKEEDDEDF